MHALAPTLSAVLLAGITLLVSSPAAQTLSEGYRSRPPRDLPAGTGTTLMLEPGVVVWFDGTALVRDAGGTTRTLLRFTNPVFGSFTVRADRGHLLFGESSRGGVWLVPLDPRATPRRLTTLAFNYDAARWIGGRAIVSAKTGGFGSADSELYAVDLRHGTTELLAVIPGASGPVAVDGDGSGVYLATAANAFPPPPGSSEVLRFTTRRLQAVRGGAPLGPGDATVIARGLDAATSLVLDDDHDLFATDYVGNRVLEISRHPGLPVTVTTLLQYGTGGPQPGRLQTVPLPAPAGPGRFEPFQPPAGTTLVVHESDFSSGASRLRSVTPQRATLHLAPAGPLPPGPFGVTLRDAAAGGTAALAITAAGAVRERPLDVPGFEQPLFWSPGALATAATVIAPVDPQGSASWSLDAPPLPFPLRLGLQAAFVSGDTRVIGSTAPRNVPLQ